MNRLSILILITSVYPNYNLLMLTNTAFRVFISSCSAIALIIILFSCRLLVERNMDSAAKPSTYVVPFISECHVCVIKCYNSIFLFFRGDSPRTP